MLSSFTPRLDRKRIRHFSCALSDFNLLSAAALCRLVSHVSQRNLKSSFTLQVNFPCITTVMCIVGFKCFKHTGELQSTLYLNASIVVNFDFTTGVVIKLISNRFDFFLFFKINPTFLFNQYTFSLVDLKLQPHINYYSGIYEANFHGFLGLFIFPKLLQAWILLVLKFYDFSRFFMYEPSELL